LLKLADKYRLAKLSLLKAKIHQIKEKEFRKKPNNIKIEKIEKEMVEWTTKTKDDILNEVKRKSKTH
jgi:TATA-binding protein-associated factor Taf7